MVLIVVLLQGKHAATSPSPSGPVAQATHASSCWPVSLGWKQSTMSISPPPNAWVPTDVSAWPSAIDPCQSVTKCTPFWLRPFVAPSYAATSAASDALYASTAP